MLTTTGMLLAGGGAALLAALLDGSRLAAAEAPNAVLLLGATAALGLARAVRRS